MTLFLKSKNRFTVSSENALDAHKQLPRGLYSLLYDMNIGYYLQETTPFSFSGKKYGENIFMTERIFNTFLDRDCSTGVLLCGEKGSGKTLLSKTLSIKAHDVGMPTILISSPFHDSEFSLLISSIEQPCLIIFDEFEKVYKEQEHQNMILSLLDGVFNTKKMFIFTVNEPYKVNQYMINRPGRIYYNIRFEGLSEEFIREYCKDNLKYSQHVDDIVSISNLIRNFNFDMIKALVEEINRYNEEPFNLLKYMNIMLQADEEEYEVVDFIYSKNSLNKIAWSNKEHNFSTEFDKININLFNKNYAFYASFYEYDYDWYNSLSEEEKTENKEMLKNRAEYRFESKNLIDFNKFTGILTFQDPSGHQVKIRKSARKPMQIHNLLF